MARTKDYELEKNRKAEILAAAGRCFVRAGLHAASMRQICAEANLSAGAVYNYFPSKEAIIEGLADQERDEIKELASYMTGETNTFKAVTKAARWIIEETSAEEMQLQIEFAAEAGRNSRIMELMLANAEALKTCFLETITRGQKAGQIGKHMKAEALADNVIALYEGNLGRVLVADKKMRKHIARNTEAAVRHLLTP